MAHAVYKSTWSTGPLQPRLDALARLAEVIAARAEQLARVLVLEMGKRISEARWEVDVTERIARYYATHGEAFLAPVKLATSQGDAWIEHHPIGVVVAVEPWNFPYYQLIRVWPVRTSPWGTPCSRNTQASSLRRRSRSRNSSQRPARLEVPGRTSLRPASRSRR